MRGNAKLVGRAAVGTVAAFGAVALVSACGGPAQSAAAPATTTTSATSGFTPVPAGAAQPATGAAAPAASTAAPRCHTSDLSIALGPKRSTDTAQSVQGELGALDHEAVAVIYTNNSGHPCTMFGFGGVDLHGPSDGPGLPGSKPQGPVFSVPRDALTPTTVLLAPGGHAHVTINYIVSDATVKWLPTGIVVTPPDETTQLTASWTTGDPVLLDSEGQVGEPSLQPVMSGS